MVFFILLSAFVVQGVLTFFFDFAQAFWIPYLLIIVCVPIGFLYSGNKGGLPRGPVAYAIAAYFFVYLIMALLGDEKLYSSIGVAKNYVLPWVMIYLMSKENESIWKRLSGWIVNLAIIQAPFVIVQRLFFSYSATEGLHWDSMVGTFGGSQDGGGFSGAMAIYLLFSVSYAYLLYDKNLLPKLKFYAVCGSFIICVLLSEVKIALVLLPVVVLFLMWIRGRLTVSGIATILTVLFVFIGGVSTLYTKMHLEQDESADEFLGEYESDVYWINPETGEVSRLGALLRWLDYSQDEPISMIFGHGPAATRVSETLGMGVMANKFSHILNTSTASVLLWEVGVIGLLIMISILVLSALRCGLLLKYGMQVNNGYAIALVQSLYVWFLIQIPLLVYNTDIVDTVPVQIFLSTAIGCIFLLKQNKIQC